MLDVSLFYTTVTKHYYRQHKDSIIKLKYGNNNSNGEKRGGNRVDERKKAIYVDDTAQTRNSKSVGLEKEREREMRIP